MQVLAVKMTCDYELYDSIDDVDTAAWERLRRGADDVFMDPPLLRVVERSMAACGRFWYVIFRDRDRAPLAAACLCLYQLDVGLLASGWGKVVVRIVKRVAPPLARVKLLYCGLPVAAGQSSLRFAAAADREEILRALDGLLLEIARREQAHCIVFRELTGEECQEVRALEDLGYTRADGSPANFATPAFRDFDHFCEGLKSRKRYPIKRSREKFAQAGLRVVHVAGREGADRLYTHEVHRLFREVIELQWRVEEPPAAFFRGLAAQLPDESLFTFIYQGDRVVAFAASLCPGSTFYQLFVGFDHQVNPRCDLYFNLFYSIMDLAFRRGASVISLGQASNHFKTTRLGAQQQPRFIYVKGARPVASALIRRAVGKRRSVEPQETLT
jgi:predicted N-acyltransferase